MGQSAQVDISAYHSIQMITNIIRQASARLISKITYSVVIVNEYKFYVDFKGNMYFDSGGPISPTNIIKDKKFIQKFYQSLKTNTEGNSSQFPLLGEFWGQKNYLRYALAPIVYTNIEEGFLQFSLGLRTEFDPKELYQDNSAQLCYSFKTDHQRIKGVLSNSLLAQLLPNIIHDEHSTVFSYKGKEYTIHLRENL